MNESTLDTEELTVSKYEIELLVVLLQVYIYIGQAKNMADHARWQSILRGPMSSNIVIT